MRKGITGVVAVVGLLSTSGVALAQGATSDAKTQLGINFALMVPQGDFERALGTNNYGVGIHSMVAIGSSPFWVGVDVLGVWYGFVVQQQPLSTTIPNVFLKVTTQDSIIGVHGLVRVLPREGVLRPYAEAVVGTKRFVTQTFVASSREELASSRNFLSDHIRSYGVGAGVQSKLSKFTALDVGVRYLRGGQATYLKVRGEGNRVVFDKFTSGTDSLTLQIGVAFKF